MFFPLEMCLSPCGERNANVNIKHRNWSKIFTLQYAHLGLCARHTISLSLKQNSAELYFGEIALEMSIGVKWAPSTFLQHFMRYGNVYNVITHCIYSLHNIFFEKLKVYEIYETIYYMVLLVSWIKNGRQLFNFKTVVFCPDPQLGPTFTDIWPPSHVECVRL